MEPKTDRFFQQLLLNAGFEIVAIDRDLRIDFCNACMAARFGCPCEEMVGRPALDIIQEHEQEKVKRLFEETIRLGVSGETEVKFVDDTGKRTTHVFVCSPIIDTGGECIGVSVCMRDISQRKRLSQELARNRRMAALGNMAAGVAHHFNNILGGMLTSIDYVLSSDSPRELRKTLRLLAQAIGRATRITNQLAAFAESENELSEWAELNSIVETFVEQLRPEADKRGIELDVQIQKVVSCQFESHRLASVLESLAANAFDSMVSGGTVRIGLREEGGLAVVTIQDTGCGMPEEVLDRVFEPFFTTRGELAGGETDNTGLGLAVVHGLVAEMGGTIELSSRVGQGTQVVVRLPLSRPDSKSGPCHDS